MIINFRISNREWKDCDMNVLFVCVLTNYRISKESSAVIHHAGQRVRKDVVQGIELQQNILEMKPAGEGPEIAKHGAPAALEK